MVIKEEKLLIELDLVAHEFTISSVSLLKEIKHHIKTQYILGGKIKTQKGPILSSEMQLSVLWVWHSASQITKFI